MREFYTDFNLIPPGFTGLLKWKNGDLRWLVNGNLHRTDGPALICGNGRKEWYYKGRRIHTSNVFYTEPNFLSPKKEIATNEETIELDEVTGHGPFLFMEKPIMFKRLLTQHGFLFVPNLPGF